MTTAGRRAYSRPAISKLGNIRDITFHHSEWSCSLPHEEEGRESDRRHYGRGGDD